MNYGMTFADRLDKRDQVFAGDSGFRLYMDPVALGYMHGAEIDYNDDGVNATFVFNNVFKSVGGSGSCGGCGGATH
jgi:Fe-S cluster assembly iron-binding protein IscA